MNGESTACWDNSGLGTKTTKTDVTDPTIKISDYKKRNNKRKGPDTTSNDYEYS